MNPEQAKYALALLQRVPLEGREVDSFIVVRASLLAIARGENVVFNSSGKVQEVDSDSVTPA